MGKTVGRYQVVVQHDTDSPENEGSVIHGPVSKEEAIAFVLGAEYANDSALTVRAQLCHDNQCRQQVPRGLKHRPSPILGQCRNKKIKNGLCRMHQPDMVEKRKAQAAREKE